MSAPENGEYIFAWKIKNYSSCYQAKDVSISSPDFCVENLLNTMWNLQFYPMGNTRVVEDGNFVSCYLRWKYVDEYNKNIEITPPVNFSLEFVDNMDIAVKYKEAEHIFSKAEDTWGWRRFIDINALSDEMEIWKDDVLTIRCRMKFKKTKSDLVTILGSEAYTIIDTGIHCFKWNLEVPMLFNHSESIYFSISDTYNFQVTLTPFLGRLKVIFHLIEHHYDLTLPLRFKLTFCDNKGVQIMTKQAKHVFQEEEIWEFPELISRKLFESTYFINSKKCEFQLKCEICVAKGTMSSSGIEKIKYQSSISYCFDPLNELCPVSQFQNDFQRLFASKKNSDVVIQVEKEEIRAHKLVLGARSPVFQTMFDQDMLERETGVVIITDIDAKTMKIFLEYLYTGKIEKTHMDLKTTKKLCIAADKYQVPSLVAKCVSILKFYLCVENACEMIAFSDMFNCECLKSYVLDFVILNAAEVLASPNWKQWTRENIELASKILFKLSSNLISQEIRNC